MKIENIKKVAVIGAGIMGSQIAEIIARLGGSEVYIIDIDDELVKKGIQAIEERLERFFVSKGKLTPQEKKDILARIKGSTSLEKRELDVDFVIEAATENLVLKKDIFKKLDENTPLHAILASNTSYQNISEMGSVTKRPDKVVGMHFFNPVSIMNLVEVVRGARTSAETLELTCSLARKLGKEPIVCRDVSYGFLANRAYGAMSQEAVQMVWERVASPEEIDKALKLGYNLPIGPLALGDMVGGWALRAASEEDRIRELGSEKGRLHPLIRAMIRAGYTGGPGRKGIYDFWKEVLSK